MNYSIKLTLKKDQMFPMSRYYEDFEVGQTFQHPIGRTITETDNTWFTLLTVNTNQMHFNKQYAEQSFYGKILVNSGLTLCLVLGLSVSDLSQNAVANLGMDEVRFSNPLFVGDTVWAESKILETRISNSRKFAGIITVFTRGLNQDALAISTWKRSFMVLKRDAPLDKNIFPQCDLALPDC